MLADVNVRFVHHFLHWKSDLSARQRPIDATPIIREFFCNPTTTLELARVGEVVLSELCIALEAPYFGPHKTLSELTRSSAYGSFKYTVKSFGIRLRDIR